MKKLFATTILSLIPALIFAGGGRMHPPTPVRGPGVPPGLAIDQYLYILFAVGIVMILLITRLRKVTR